MLEATGSRVPGGRHRVARVVWDLDAGLSQAATRAAGVPKSTKRESR
jgi:hypothetical protein